MKPSSTNTSTTSPAPSSPIAGGEAQTFTFTLAAYSSQSHDSVPAERRSASPSHSDALMEDDGDRDILKGFPTSITLEAQDTQLASAYAAETRNVLGAELFIAERRYHQILLAAQSYKRRMLRARTRFKKASEDVIRFRNLNAVGDNPEQLSTSQLAAGLA